MLAPAFLLDLRFIDLDGWWMRLDCCGRSTCIPFRTLALQKPSARLGELLNTLRCKDCRQSPRRVVLVENPADRAHGWTGSGGWRIEIIVPDCLIWFGHAAKERAMPVWKAAQLQAEPV